jgi:hypothetical protein
VAGATVTFTLGGGNTATFAGGVQTLSVATNAAGRAAVSALNPLASGAVQINVQAAFQGQAAAATITQTNVLTAAQAAGASATGAAGGTGSGGGISGTTVGVIGGAAAGAVLGAKALGGEASATGSTGASPVTYSGPFTIQTVQTNSNTLNGVPQTPCTRLITIVGTITIRLGGQGSGSVPGNLDAELTQTNVAGTCAGATRTGSNRVGGSLNGTTGNLLFNRESTSTGMFRNDDGTLVGTGPLLSTQAFAGALGDGVITGTWTMSYRGVIDAPVNPAFGHTEEYPPTGTPVTLTKQ